MNDIITIAPVLPETWAILIILIGSVFMLAAVVLWFAEVPSWASSSLLFIGSAGLLLGLVAIGDSTTDPRVAASQAQALLEKYHFDPIDVRQASPNNVFQGRGPDGAFVSGMLVKKDTDVYIVIFEHPPTDADDE